MITPRTLLRHELIGLWAAVEEAHNRSLIGIQGRIIDETRNMLTLETTEGEKQVAKRGAIFLIRLPDATTVRVDGSVLVMAPERRTSMRATPSR
ncbi:MAG: ribonuclease P protein component 1 [Methanomicrobiales archaeon]